MEPNNKDMLIDNGEQSGSIGIDPFSEAVNEVLEGVPQEKRKVVQRLFSMVSVSQRTSPQAELMRTLTPDNIDQFIKAQDASDERHVRDRKDNRWFIFAVLIACFVMLIAVILILKNSPDLLEIVLTAIVSLSAGAFGGYGVGYRKGSSDSDD